MGSEVLGKLREPWGVLELLGKIRQYWGLLGYLSPLELPPLNARFQAVVAESTGKNIPLLTVSVNRGSFLWVSL